MWTFISLGFGNKCRKKELSDEWKIWAGEVHQRLFDQRLPIKGDDIKGRSGITASALMVSDLAA